MKLEKQLEALSELGIRLEDGITIDDLLYSFSRDQYEGEPFELILFVLGIEVERKPWGRCFCNRAWNLDMECISGTGDYVKIAERLCLLAGVPNRFANLQDCVDLENGLGWLQYEVDGVSRHFDVAINHDWADPEVIAKVMADIESDGFRFYSKDNGQAAIWYYLDQETADRLNSLSGGALVQGP